MVLTGAELARLSEAELAEDLNLFPHARANPEQKLNIVQALQKSGEVVAVTGDGINDAPALKTADIGIAMGETGTEVARETAGMVLTDDSFTSVAAGVREGRKIYDNLKKGVTYYLAVKVALVLTFLVPLALSLPFPFAPIQIICWSSSWTWRPRRPSWPSPSSPAPCGWSTTGGASASWTVPCYLHHPGQPQPGGGGTLQLPA